MIHHNPSYIAQVLVASKANQAEVKKENDEYTQSLNKQKTNKTETFKMGMMVRCGSCWIGGHWAPYNKRLCVNIIPFVTFWFVLPGGTLP